MSVIDQVTGSCPAGELLHSCWRNSMACNCITRHVADVGRKVVGRTWRCPDCELVAAGSTDRVPCEEHVHVPGRRDANDGGPIPPGDVDG